MNEIDTDKAPMSREEQKTYQARQKQRAVVTAGILIFFVVLFYLITFVKIGSAL